MELLVVLEIKRRWREASMGSLEDVGLKWKLCMHQPLGSASEKMASQADHKEVWK